MCVGQCFPPPNLSTARHGFMPELPVLQTRIPSGLHLDLLHADPIGPGGEIWSCLPGLPGRLDDRYAWANQGPPAKFPIEQGTGVTHVWSDIVHVAHTRSSKETPASILWQGPSAISSISFEDPWVAATLLDGTLLLLNAEHSIRSGRRGPVAPANLGSRARQFPGQGGSAYCVQLADQWMACGSGKPPPVAL
jgi:hypothetical protein